MANDVKDPVLRDIRERLAAEDAKKQAAVCGQIPDSLNKPYASAPPNVRYTIESRIHAHMAAAERLRALLNALPNLATWEVEQALTMAASYWPPVPTV